MGRMEEASGQAAGPTPAERMAGIQEQERGRRRRGFLIGLLVGQLLVIALDYGGEALIRAIQHKYPFRAPVPLRALVFTGMTAGVVLTGILICLVLGMQGVGYVFGKKQVGFFPALWRGIKRIWKAAWAVGLTLGVVGGTSWLLIPQPEWKPTAVYLRDKGVEGYQAGKGWVRSVVKPPAPPP